MKISAFKTDADRIEGGEWVENIPGAGDLRLKVRGLQNAQYRRMYGRLIDAVPRDKRRGGRVDPDELDRITSTCLAETVLLGWEGLEGDDGQPLPYAKDQAKTFLTSPDYRDFRDAVIVAATRVGEREAEAVAADVGNSSGT